jgi:hypothetical protein
MLGVLPKLPMEVQDVTKTEDVCGLERSLHGERAVFCSRSLRGADADEAGRAHKPLRNAGASQRSSAIR